MSELNRTTKDLSVEERAILMAQFERSGLEYAVFAREHNLNPATLKNWIWLKSKPKGEVRRYTPVERKKMVEAYLSIKEHQSIAVFSEAWGVSGATLRDWVKRYELKGSDGLMNCSQRKALDGRVGPKTPAVVQAAIISEKKSKPSSGIKRIAQNLFRFKGIKVSPNTVKKTIVQEGLPLAKKPRKKKRSTDRIRRFERARPMQLWQSDITQYTFAVNSARVYLTVFMDDHSRYIVGWRLGSRQTSEFVMDAFKDACVRFGKPEEVLTDQGRQYFAWRGKSDLEKYLEKEGIKHVVSRAHHPQTLGKCERFWETVGNEFWRRARPQDLDEARVRLKHCIDHYNHHRPHQGLGGAVPADRFFGVADEVRSQIEKAVAENAHAMSIGELPQAPAFLIGQVGDQRVAFHGRGGSFYLTHENANEENHGIRSERSIESRNGIIGNQSSEVQESAKGKASGSGGCSDLNPSPLAESGSRGASGGEQAGFCDDGVLDGAHHQISCGGEVSAQTDSILAAIKSSNDGNDGGFTASAKVALEDAQGSIGGE